MLGKEKLIPLDRWHAEQARGLKLGLPGADSLDDKTIPTFSRGELPHFAGINTFMKAPYCEDAHLIGNYDACVLGVPFDGGTTYRPGTRFGPQGMRRISALYTPYNYEIGVDLREQMTLCDAGDVFTIPANIEKTFDQISNAVGHVFRSGAFPVILGGDHSIGFATVRGIARETDKKIGIIHFDRHADIQEKDLDERMHTTPWFHATNLPNVPAKNLVQIGIGGWQVPREAIAEARKRDTTIITMNDVVELGLEKVAEIALEKAWDGTDAVYLSLRHRLRGLRLRAGHRLAGAGRLSAARDPLPDRRGGQGRPVRHGGGGSLPALRHVGHHRAAGRAGLRGRARHAGGARQNGLAQTHDPRLNHSRNCNEKHGDNPSPRHACTAGPCLRALGPRTAGRIAGPAAAPPVDRTAGVGAGRWRLVPARRAACAFAPTLRSPPAGGRTLT